MNKYLTTASTLALALSAPVFADIEATALPHLDGTPLAGESEAGWQVISYQEAAQEGEFEWVVLENAGDSALVVYPQSEAELIIAGEPVQVEPGKVNLLLRSSATKNYDFNFFGGRATLSGKKITAAYPGESFAEVIEGVIYQVNSMQQLEVNPGTGVVLTTNGAIAGLRGSASMTDAVSVPNQELIPDISWQLAPEADRSTLRLGGDASGIELYSVEGFFGGTTLDPFPLEDSPRGTISWRLLNTVTGTHYLSCNLSSDMPAPSFDTEATVVNCAGSLNEESSADIREASTDDLSWRIAWTISEFSRASCELAIGQEQLFSFTSSDEPEDSFTLECPGDINIVDPRGFLYGHRLLPAEKHPASPPEALDRTNTTPARSSKGGSAHWLLLILLGVCGIGRRK